MGTPVMQRSFAAGELAPAHHARADLVKFVTGLKTCKNFLVRAEGGVSNRAGFRYVATAKTATAGTKLYRFDRAGDTESDVLIEAGQGYFRFYVDGAPVEIATPSAWSAVTAYTVGDLVREGGVNYYCVADNTNEQPPDTGFWYPLTGNIYEIPNPYTLAQLPKFDQSGFVATLTNRGVEPRELFYRSLTEWVLAELSTLPTIAAPANLAASAGASGTLPYAYVVTAAKADSYEESVASGADDVACLEPTPEDPNTLTWDAVAGAAEYYVYCDPYGNGVFGFIGTATTNAFNDTGFIPDFAVTPPVARVMFDAANNYPEVAASYQQRRFFANTNNEPDGFWGSRVGFPSNFGISSPLQDDDSLTFRLAGNANHAIRWLVALKVGLIAFTRKGEWTVTGTGGAGKTLTPNGINADQELYVGCDRTVEPQVVGNTILYLQEKGKIWREVRFDQAVEGLAGKDLTIFAAHLFKGKRIVSAAYQQNPDSILWCVRNDGVLLGLTYIPEQEVWGWHRHETRNGTIEEVCVVSEGEEDVVYILVARVIGGQTVRYIERLESRDYDEEDFSDAAFFVDSGLSYNGPAVDRVEGLDHLIGQVVAVVADGRVVFNGDPDHADSATYTVDGAGGIDLPEAANDVHVGLGIRFGDLELLPLDVAGSDARDRKKRVASVTLLVDRSGIGWKVGPNEDELRPAELEPSEGSPNEFTGQIEISVPTGYDKNTSILIRQDQPLPLTVLGVIPNVGVGE